MLFHAGKRNKNKRAVILLPTGGHILVGTSQEARGAVFKPGDAHTAKGHRVTLTKSGSKAFYRNTFPDSGKCLALSFLMSSISTMTFVQ